MKSKTFVAGSRKEHFRGREHAYRRFLPSPVNKPYQWGDARIPVLLEQAVWLVGELNAYSVLIPDVDFFMLMHVQSEAVKSSSIEGTKTGLDEVVLPEEEIAPEKRDDWTEVHNYVKAMNHAVERLDNLPVSMRLLKEAHTILMTGVRGENKQPGEVRTMQNRVGGTSIQTASYIPPHPGDLSQLLRDLELFWHNQSLQMPFLIKVAISHYQFETIHPFNDGNGRIGRMLIILHLMERGILRKPILYLSDFFEKNKGAYYDALTFVRDRNDMDQWILFFLSAIIETSRKGKSKFEKIVKLREDYEERIGKLGRRGNHVHKLLPRLFSLPVITVAEIVKYLEISMGTANTLVNQLEREGFLNEITGHSRNRIFVLHEYLDLFRE